MRELKDYFCTETQTKKLIELGFDGDMYIISAEYYYILSIPFNGILRSQALDFFRDKGYEHFVTPFTQEDSRFEIYVADDTYGYYIFKSKEYAIDAVDFCTYHEAESALIDKLIELLETEAQHGE